MMFVCRPSSRDVSLAIAMWSPVTIFTSMPRRLRRGDRRRRVVARRVVEREQAEKLPPACRHVDGLARGGALVRATPSVR